MEIVRVFNPDNISVYDIDRLISYGYVFDIIAGLDEDEYDDIEQVISELLEEQSL